MMRRWAAVMAVAVGGVAVAFSGGIGAPATLAHNSSTGQIGSRITAITSSPGLRTLTLRGGRVEWLTVAPRRYWTPVSLPGQPTAVAVTNRGVGLVGESDGVVLALAPGADHASAVVADYLWSPVVALAGMGILRHLEMLISTTSGTYSVGLKGPLAVWWPHQEATAVVAPETRSQVESWAAIVGGHLVWTSITPRPATGAVWSPGTWLRFKKTSSATWTLVWRVGSWSSYPSKPANAWTRASSRAFGANALLAGQSGGYIAVATHGGAVLAGFPGSGLTAELHTVPANLLGPTPVPTGLVGTAGNALVLSTTDSPLLGWGWSGWSSVGAVADVHLLAAVGGNVVEVLAGGSLRVVPIDPALAFSPPVVPMPPWLGPVLGFAVILALLGLAGVALWRLPSRARAAVVAAAKAVKSGR